MNKVAIIIVNWNTNQYLADCIKSLANLPQTDIDLIDEVIVVDNASSDKSIIKAKQVVGENINKPRVRFVQNEKNIGFAAANNIGIERVSEKEENPHILLLNPDVVVSPSMLSGLTNVLNNNEKAGIVGAKLIGNDGALQPSVRHFPTKKEMVLYMLKLGSSVQEENIDYDVEQKVDQVMGAAFLIRNELLDSVGNLDEDFFLWFEEVDYCKRAINKEWEVWYTPSAQCTHYGGVSFGQLIGFNKTMPWLKSMLTYARKHMDSSFVSLLYLLSGINLILSIPASIVHLAKRK
jgi:N-acetylglucosaminyl-diphospho-decaprenol L-rhamnosyltransferase